MPVIFVTVTARAFFLLLQETVSCTPRGCCFCGESVPPVAMTRAASAAESLARRATQCSFSSAFHITGSSTQGFSATVERTYTVLICPAVALLGGAALWRLGSAPPAAVGAAARTRS